MAVWCNPLFLWEGLDDLVLDQRLRRIRSICGWGNFPRFPDPKSISPGGPGEQKKSYRRFWCLGEKKLAGAWKGAIRSWEYLKSLHSRELRSYPQASKHILENHRSWAACEFFSWKAPGLVEETGNIWWACRYVSPMFHLRIGRTKN